MREHIFKKYANRRLYDTDNARYVGIDAVAEALLRFEYVRVDDADSGEDITESVLLQILVKQQQEADKPLMSRQILSHLIRMYASPYSRPLFEGLEQFLSWATLRQSMTPENNPANPNAQLDLLAAGNPWLKAWMSVWSQENKPTAKEKS